MMFLINKVIIILMSAKMVTPGLLKIKEFSNTGYDVINFFHDFTNKISSHHANYIVDVAM